MVLNTPNSAGIALKEGVVAAMRKVNTIAVADGSSTISSGAIQVYADSVMVRYNDVRTLAAGTIPASVRPTTTEEKLEVIMYEKYVASFGYGVDVYTDFRRTHHPRIHVSQQAVDPALGLLPDDGATQANGKFPRRFLYPTNDLILNPNSPRVQPDPSNPIFWER